MSIYTLLKNRAGFGNQLLHGLSNVQAEFGNEVVDSEIIVFIASMEHFEANTDFVPHTPTKGIKRTEILGPGPLANALGSL